MSECLQCWDSSLKGVHTCVPAASALAPLQAAHDELFNTAQANQNLFAAQSAMPPPIKAFDRVEVVREGKPKGGRPKGFDGTRSKQPSALAQAFMKAGLDWKQDFALAIKAASSSVPKERTWGKERIKLWLKLLPYMITTSSRAKVRRWKGRPSKAAMIALETLEGRDE